MSFDRTTHVRRFWLPALVVPALLCSQVFLLEIPGSAAMAQDAGRGPRDEVKNDGTREASKPEPRPSAANGDVKRAKQPTMAERIANRVYQRRSDDRADIPLALSDGAETWSISNAILNAPNGFATPARFRDGKVLGVPTGGPYSLNVSCLEKETGATHLLHVGPFFVGDLWVLAGQSNMEGVGDLVDVTPPSDHVMALGMDGKWATAEEPLHWLVDSPDPVHSGNPADRPARSEAQHRSRTKGAGLGLPFGAVMAASTNVPIGLVACAHGGTSMAQWDPAKKGEGGESLYGSMLRQLKLAGGKFRGVLWYQGESDAMSGAEKVYPRAFADFIAAVRDDVGQADLPFYFVQIGRFIKGGDPKPWNAVQDAQRQLPDRVPNTAVVASIDLELDDVIHVGTQGLKRLGTRVARIALREQFGYAGATTPTFDRVSKQGGNVLVVKFKGVNRAPSASGVPQRPQPRGLNPAAALNGASVAPSVSQPLDGLQPTRHIAGFSIRKDDGTEIPLIFDAAVGQSRDTVLLKLVGAVPEGANLWYGYGFDPYCNLVDALDMAVPVFGPIPLDEIK